MEQWDSVWPRPQEIVRRHGCVRPDLGRAIETKGEADWLEAEARRIGSLLRTTRAASASGGEARPRAGVTLAGMDAVRGATAVRQPEGYVLDIRPDRILLAGADARGLYCGAQTLRALIEAGEGGIPCGTVRDWPRFPIRGAHLYLPPREHLDFFRRFLDFMAGYRLNTLILEIGGGMEYEKHPEINRAWKKFCREALAYDFDKDDLRPESKRSPEHFHPMFPRTGPVALQVSRYYRKDSTHTELAGGEWLTKEEIRGIIAECAARHIEIIPEVQSLSHSYYLCCAHPEIAEAQDDPWPDTYCPSNPKSYELLFDVMDEVIALFQPRIMHIGHDEAYTFRMCPKCRKRTGYDILAGDLNRIHDFLASRGVRTMLWGDKLMHLRRYGGAARRERDPGTGKTWVQPATWKAVDKVPKDLLICDWYWSLDPRSERNFHRHGFQVVYGNFSPLGFKEWQTRADVPYVLGAEMSTWCEVSAYEFGHNDIYYQFFPGSDMLWTGRQMPREEVCRRMARRVTREIDAVSQEVRYLASGGKGRELPLDLAGVAVPLPDALAGKVPADTEVQTLLGTGGFRLLAEQGALCRAIVLDKGASKARPVPAGWKARSLLLLHGTTMEGVFRQPTYYSYHRGPAALLEWTVRYADGKRAAFKSFYGEDIGPIEGAWPTRHGGYCFRSVPVALGDAWTFFAQEWKNPRPGVVIESVSVRLGPDATDKGEVIVAAVSAVV